MMVAAVLLFIGLILLVAGGELLVRSASRLAGAAGLSPLFIGLTVVAFGTSSPELVVSLRTALRGEAAISLGNVVGSNLFNVLLILGAAAVVAPLLVKRQLVRWDVPLMIAVSVVMWGMSLDASLSRGDGLLLLAGLVLYLWRSYRLARNEDDTAPEVDAPPVTGGMLAQSALLLAGVGVLVVGCELFVRGAIQTAQILGLSESVIGLTIVAAGTSLPELATSVVASFRGERDIAVGNVVGSNLFNILGVLGVASLAAPAGVPVSPQMIGFDMPVMIAAAALCLPVFFTGWKITRSEGALLTGLYIAYTAYLLVTNEATPL